MATLSTQSFDEAGNDLTMSAASAGGDEFSNDGRKFLVIYNGDASSTDVTITAQNTSFEDERYGNSVKEDQTLTVSAGNTAIMGPFPTKAFNDSNNNAQVTYTSVTSLEVAVVKES